MVWLPDKTQLNNLLSSIPNPASNTEFKVSFVPRPLMQVISIPPLQVSKPERYKLAAPLFTN